MLNTPGVQDGGFIVEVDGRVAINRTDVFYRDRPLERDHGATPFCDPNPQADDSLLGPLLGGLIGTGIESERNQSAGPSCSLDSWTGLSPRFRTTRSEYGQMRMPIAIRHLNQSPRR